MVIQFFPALYSSPVWVDPDVFLPERFMDVNKDAPIKGMAYSPFGVGLRKCVGEELARLELAMYLANLMLYYEFSSVEKDGKMPMDEFCGISLRPVHTQMRVKTR